MKRLSPVLLSLFLLACPEEPGPQVMVRPPAKDMPAEDASPDLPEDMPTPPEDMPQDIAPDLPEDMPQDMPQDVVLPPLGPNGVLLPLGETLFLDGDDYLADWGAGAAGEITLTSSPDGARAQVVQGRLTPDVPGEWKLSRGEDEINVRVLTNFLDEDTFLNYNYTPVAPLLRVGDEVWVASPPSNAVQRVTWSGGTLTAGDLIPTGSWPVALASWGDLILVSQAGRDSLGIIDPSQNRVVDAIPVGDEPASILVDGDIAYVALAGARQVARVDLTTKTVTARVNVGRKPRAMAFHPGTRTLYVASLISSNAHPRGKLQDIPIPASEQRDIAAIDVDTFAVEGWILEVGTILRGMYVDGDRLLISASESRNDKSGVAADSRPHEYVLVEADIAAQSATRHEVTQRIVLDSPAGPAASPFTIARTNTRGTEELIVSLSASKSLLVLDPETLAERERIPTGNDPRGLLFDSGHILTYAWLDNKLEVMGAGGQRSELEVGRDPTPADIKEGQRMFNDATFSKNKDFSCNNCHIDGITDGLVWNILLDGDVNTLAFRNVSGTGPFLWGGFLPTLFDFSREVLRLVGATATGSQMEKLTMYMQSVTAPPNPYTLPGGRLTQEQQTGRDLFYGQAGCGGCHSGPLFTNGQVVDPAKSDKPTDVPSLIATYDSGPWGREGQWTTLEEMTEFAAAFTESSLSPAELNALTAFVYALPGDVLYLNASEPQKDDLNVYSGVEPKLVFSSLLAENQASRFSFERNRNGSWRGVPGMWTTRGRTARFEPSGPLNSETSYRITAREGIEGVFGRKTLGDIVLPFTIGALPDVDVSGTWKLDFRGQINGSVNVALLQSRGGKVTGALLESDGNLDFDNVQGYVAGNQLFVGEFTALTPFGSVQVESMEIDLTESTGDMYADSGTGVLRSVVTLNIIATRLSLPE